MKAQTSRDAGCVCRVRSLVYVGVHASRVRANCCPPDARLRFHCAKEVKNGCTD